MSKKVQVLFICTGNSARSQMSEGLLRKMAGELADIYSAGTEPSDRVNSSAVKVMAENGIDISKHYPKKVGQFLGKDIDIAVTTCDGARKACPAFPGIVMNYHWNLEDPAAADGTEEERMGVFRKTFAEISERAAELMEVIRRIYSGEIPRKVLPGLPEV